MADKMKPEQTAENTIRSWWYTFGKDGKTSYEMAQSLVAYLTAHGYKIVPITETSNNK